PAVIDCALTYLVNAKTLPGFAKKFLPAAVRPAGRVSILPGVGAVQTNDLSPKRWPVVLVASKLFTCTRPKGDSHVAILAQDEARPERPPAARLPGGAPRAGDAGKPAGAVLEQRTAGDHRAPGQPGGRPPERRGRRLRVGVDQLRRGRLLLLHRARLR